MKEFNLFDFIKIMEENKGNLKYEEMFVNYLIKLRVNGVVIESKNEGLICVINLKNAIYVNDFNLKKFIDRLFKLDNVIIKRIREITFYCKYVKKIRGYHLVKFLDKVLKTSGYNSWLEEEKKIGIKFYPNDEEEKSKEKRKIYEMDDFNVVKELL